MPTYIEGVERSAHPPKLIYLQFTFQRKSFERASDILFMYIDADFVLGQILIQTYLLVCVLDTPWYHMRTHLMKKLAEYLFFFPASTFLMLNLFSKLFML